MANSGNPNEQRRRNRGVSSPQAADFKAAGLGDESPQPPFTISGRYEVTETLGEGGMGAVYQARDTLLGRSVAIKVMLPRYVSNPQASQRFFREAQALAHLNHPNILILFDYGREEDRHFLVMELGGDDVGRLLEQQQGPLSLEHARQVATAVCRALEYAHQQGVIHRDIKPANILVGSADHPGWTAGQPEPAVKVMNFGLAKIRGASGLTTSPTELGTPHYMSPEQISGRDANELSDLYAFGVVLYELYTGMRPFDSEDPQTILAQHLSLDPVPPSTFNPEIPSYLEALILQLLEKDPARRPTSAGEVLRALEAPTPATQADARTGDIASGSGSPSRAPRRRTDFGREVRDALAHLYDTPYLQTHPLAQLLGDLSAVRPSAVGQALQQRLVEAIERLRPDPESPGSARAERRHELMRLRYVEALEVPEVCERLGVSQSEFYREHGRGLDAIVAHLTPHQPELAVGTAPSGTVTFLFTDIEGSTILWEQQPEAMKTALARHDALLRKVIESNSGYVFKTIGDAFCATFRTARDALAAALAGQQVLASETWGETGTIKVRMALHTGVSDEQDGDYFGPSVNRVARLLSAGYGGQILLSHSAAELAEDGLPDGVTLRDFGEHRLKDLPSPERIFQVVAPNLPADFPTLKTLTARPNNLPAHPTPLIGRERELEAVSALLLREDVRLLTLTGTGGTGKTRLGLQLAADMLERFDDGAFFVNLAPISEPDLVDSAIAQAIGLQETAGRPLLDSLKESLRDKHILLLMDNFEHILPAAVLVADLLAACPQLKVLATSRAPLHLRGEHEFFVPPLDLPDTARDTAMEAIAESPAVALFTQRAQAVRPDFAITAENGPAVAEICIRLDGLPLAIELAAARSKLLPPQALLARLEPRLPLLTGGPRDLPERHQTLRGTLDWSYDLLEPPEQRLFHRLAVFAGGCSLGAVEAVCMALGEPQVSVLDGLAALVDNSVLRQEDSEEPEPRFLMQQTVQEYAREKLQESAEEDNLRRQHLTYYLALAEQAEPELTGPQQADWLRRLETEHNNLRTALGFSLNDASFHAAGLRLAGTLSRFWRLHGYLSEGRRWLDALIAKSTEAPIPARARALYGAGFLAYHQGDYGAALPALEQGLDLFRGVQDQLGAGDALQLLALTAWRQGDYHRAVILSEESLAVYRPLGDTRKLAVVLNNLGLVVRRQGDYRRARTLYEESLAIKRELGDEAAAAITLHNLGNIALDEEGDYVRAATLEQESVEIARRLGDKRGVAMALISLGDIAMKQGNHSSAAGHYQESLKLANELGDKPRIAECLEGLAIAAGAQGDSQRTIRLLSAGESLRAAIGAPLSPAQQDDVNQALHEARLTLDNEAFGTASAQGRAMPLDQVMIYALAERTGASP